MNIRKTGITTVSVGLVAIGILMILHFTGLVSVQVLKYFGPCLLILFGFEIIWSLYRQAGQRMYFSVWSVILLVVVLFISLVQFIYPGGFGWQTGFISPVHGQVSVDSGIKHVDIRIPEGKIKLIGTTEPVLSYDGSLEAGASSQSKADEIIQANWKVRKSGDTIEMILELTEPQVKLFNIFDWTHETPYLNVQVPQALLTKVVTKNGGVDVVDMNADVDIKSSNGGMTVKNVRGNVKAMTSNGSFTIEEINGSVEVQTSNGSISLTNISGSVSASSSNGAMKGNSSVNGKWDFHTSNGNITLTIPEKTNATLQARTSKDHVGGDVNWHSDAQKQYVSKLGTGTNPITLSTSNGSIIVNYAE
jgi:hypothetical protein